MLVNLTPNNTEIARRTKIALKEGFEFIPQCDERFMQYGVGIYQCNFDFNFSEDEFEEFNRESVDRNLIRDNRIDIFHPTYHKVTYGVADSVEQVKNYYKEEIEDLERKFFIYVTPVFQEKENRGKGGGWRWCKWGEYIGVLDSQFEYLDDEDFGEDFKYVLCFSIVEVK